MDFLTELQNEKEVISQMLEYYRGLPSGEGPQVLTCKNTKNRGKQFLVRKRGEKKPKYIKKNDTEQLRFIVKSAISERAMNILEHNFKALERVSTHYRRYDIGLVYDMLPKAYQNAINWIGELDLGAPEIKAPELSELADPSIPSENPKNRKNLKYPLSNGLMVRSKSEAIIGEYLLAAGIPFRYEKRLELVTRYVDEAGFEHISTEWVYSDFTIFLPNGGILLWEHEGLLDDMKYRRRNIRKMMLYFENGFYIPRNLIVTMEGGENTFDPDGTLRIITGFIKPLFN